MKVNWNELNEKHKDFIIKIETDLCTEGDYYGNARRLEEYLEKFLKSNVDDYQEKKLIVNKMIEDYDISAQYDSYLDQFDGPRWYLEKTYPIFYEHFKERFEKFLTEWKTATKKDDFAEEFKDELFVTYCRYINSEIDIEMSYKHALKFIEKNGFPSTTKGKINMTETTFITVLETLFELPEFILHSFNIKEAEWKKAQVDYQAELLRRNREQEIAHNKIKNLSKQKRTLIDNAKRPNKVILIKLADETRKKNGKINYTAMAKKIARTNHSIRKWCNEEGIK